jgi:hypothetical protein
MFSSFISIIFFHAFLTRCEKVGIPSPLTYNSMNINRFIKHFLNTSCYLCESMTKKQKKIDFLVKTM